MRSLRSFVSFPLLALLALAACQSNRDALLADLQSPRPEERALAVKKLAAQGKPEDLILFTQAAKDVAAMVRGEAASALGSSQDARVVDLLGELLEDPDEGVQARAAMALAEVKNGKAKSYLTLQYGRRGRSTRLAIVQALKSSNVPGAMAEVVAAESKGLWESNLRALQDGTLPERVGAAEALGRSGRVEAVDRLLPLIRDSQVILAAAAVRGLAEAGDRRATGPITALLKENFPELREAAASALAQMQEPAAVPGLLAVAVEKSSSSAVATQALLALPRSKETDEALCSIVREGALRDALAAGREMRRREGCALEPVLERLGRPRDALAGLQAVQALGPAAKAALPRVLPLLQSSDSAVRLAALEAAGAVGEASAGPAIRKLLDAELATLAGLRADWVAAPAAPPPARAAPAPAPEQRRTLKDLMRKLGEADEARAEAVGRPLVAPRPPAEVVDDVEPEQLRLAAVALRALGRVRAEGALELLTPYAEDPAPLLRSAAREGLAWLGPQGMALAARELSEGDLASRTAVAQALAEQGGEGQQLLVASLEQVPGDRSPLLEALLPTGVPAEATARLEPLVTQGGLEAALAARLLARSGARTAVPALVRALEDPTSGARPELLRALGELGDAAVAPVLARDLCHDLPEIRAAAAEALARAGTAEQVEALDALKGDYHRRVREAAEAALTRLNGRLASEGTH